ncbi:hypothetical protein [Salipiger thiooxidans]|uniref:hypothetical protein n=1 Tax=Salipiger thiooxidans TaxID=282683 RepID=UPI001CD79C68|nr:hypothetical protein [Salipiger thiooxidans]MCA0849239.1 hypothetical protein [Salipiger thiooxidans]
MADDRFRRGAALVMVAVGLWRAALTVEAGSCGRGSRSALIAGLCGLTCLRAGLR